MRDGWTRMSLRSSGLRFLCLIDGAAALLQLAKPMELRERAPDDGETCST
jgi:hypothetical protein